MSKIGLQLYTIGDIASKDFLGTVKRVADLGYEAVQFAGFFNTPATELKQVLDEKGLVVAGSHTSLDLLNNDRIDEVLEYNHGIGNELIIWPWLPEDERKTADQFKRFADKFNQLGEICKNNGFRFAYHNHAFEFDVLDSGEQGFDILFGNTEPALVKMELDCYWALYADLDPIEIIHKYKDRVVSLHIKDLKRVDGQKMSTEVGNGELNVKAILEIGKQYGIPWFTVEQEHFIRNPLESVEISVRNLKAIVASN